MKALYKIVVLGALSVFPVKTSDFLKQFVKSDQNQKFFIGFVEERQHQLDEALKAENELVAANKISAEEYAHDMEEIKGALFKIDADLKINPDDEKLLKKQSLLRESEEIIKDIQPAQENYASTMRERIHQLEIFSRDPYFENFKKKHKMQDRSDRAYYTFDDLQSLHEDIVDYERRVNQLVDQEKSMKVEKEGRKRLALLLQEEQEKRAATLNNVADILQNDTFSHVQTNYEKEIASLEDQLLKNKQVLADFRIKEINEKERLVEFQLFLVKSFLELFRKQLNVIKTSIRISEADVLLAEEDLLKEQKAYFAQKDSLRTQLEKIVRLQKAKEKEVAELSKQLNIPLNSDLDEWTKKPKQTADSYVSYTLVGALNTELLLLAKEKELLEGQLTAEEERFNYKSLRINVKKTFYKMFNREFFSEEDIIAEHNEYDAQKKETGEKLKLYQTKISAVSNILTQLKKTLDRVVLLSDEATKQKDILFREKPQDYDRCINNLKKAEVNIKQEIDVLGKLTGVYSVIVSELSSIMRLVDFTNTELQSSTIWYRPAYAITIEGIKNIISDIQAFEGDVRTYISQLNVGLIVSYINQSLASFVDVVLIIFKIVLCFLFLYLLIRYADTIRRFFFVTATHYGLLVGVSSFVIGTLLLFIRRYWFVIFVWMVINCFVSLIGDQYIYILLYLFSIPYFLYISYKCVQFLMMMNREYGFILLPEDFQRRFEIVFSILLYTSAAIFFFRQAFMLSSVYVRSELPNILLALNFIVLQISLIFLITKEQIMAIIPERADFWRWVRSNVDYYYYFILLFVIAIIIMSNPYVGFGRLVLYLLSCFIQTALLLKLLLLLHDGVKKISSVIFFSQDDLVLRERFVYGKTCFGLVIIGSFVVLGFIGFVASAKIWGWHIGFSSIKYWLSAPLLLEGTTHPITTISLLKLIMYMFGGFAVAYALKEYVLARIFDLLLVESGVQHTVKSIIQYVVIVVAVFIGFQSVGLGLIIGNMFLALAFSIGLYIKDPISDFVSYFIILVQRPVKIGDYVQVDEDTMGVVRKITPRAVILRRKNSTTIVVPNSYLVSKSIENWNYVRNFVAINDIILFVYFKEDPLRVKEILASAIETHSKVLKNPPPIIRLINFTEYGYEFMVRGFISSAYTLEMWDIGSDIRLLIAKAFRENGVEFAIPMYRVDSAQKFGEGPLIKEKKDNPHEHETENRVDRIKE